MTAGAFVSAAIAFTGSTTAPAKMPKAQTATESFFKFFPANIFIFIKHLTPKNN